MPIDNFASQSLSLLNDDHRTCMVSSGVDPGGGAVWDPGGQEPFPHNSPTPTQMGDVSVVRFRFVSASPPT